MSIAFGEKIGMLKDAEGLSRPQFCQLVDVPVQTMRKIESGTNPSVEIAQKICMAFPQYTLWLMTGQINPEAGQISPEIRKARQRSQPSPDVEQDITNYGNGSAITTTGVNNGTIVTATKKGTHGGAE